MSQSPSRPRPVHRSSVRFAERRTNNAAADTHSRKPNHDDAALSDDIEELPYENGHRAYNVHDDSHEDDGPKDRRGSDDSGMTLHDPASSDSSLDKGKGREFDHDYPPPRRTDRDHYYPQPPPGPSRHMGYSVRDIENPYGMDRTSHSRGVLRQIKDGFRHFTNDPDHFTQPCSRPHSPMTSRRSSWADPTHLGREPNNFETSLAINEDDEQTYLYAEDERFNKDPTARERLADVIPHPGHPDRHQSYAERRKKKQHVIHHCAEPMEEYQKFTLTFAKALLTFGSPSHRVEAQLNSLAKVFQMEAQFLHTPGIIQVSFGNPESRTSETCLIKSSVGLALSRIHAVHNIYRAVIHDDMYASDGTRELRKMLQARPRYGAKARFVLSWITCFLICGIAFGGSLNDMWVAGVMGVVVRVLQNIASKSELSASGSEVFTAAIVSFAARGFASFYSQIWCFTAISSSAIISILPGFLILAGSLDIAGRNSSLGAPKIVSGIMTALYLGFGLTLGSDLFLFVDRPARRALEAAANAVGQGTTLTGNFQAFNGTSSTDSFIGSFTFSNSTASAAAASVNVINGCYRDPSWGWYLQPVPYWTLFILVPLFAFFASMNNQQHWWSRQMLVMVVIACVSFWITRLANIHWGLEDHPDYVSLIGSFLVGVLGNGYSRRFGGTAFTSMLTGILLLVPDGLAAAGGLADNYTSSGGGSNQQDEYTQSLTLARKMISVVIGIMAGVYISAALVYVFGKKKNAALVTF